VSGKARRVLAHLAGRYVWALSRHPPFRYACEARCCGKGEEAEAASRAAAGRDGSYRGPSTLPAYRTP
jgi:hypothetical protein